MISFVRAYLVCIVLSTTHWASVAYAQPTSTVDGRSPAAAELLQEGIELEKEHQWARAIQHYEAATRSYPVDGELRRRLLISRLHYDVVRRSTDASIDDLLNRLTETQALELYSEVIARLEMSYVEPVDMTEIVRGGTAYLEVALTEQGFVGQHIPQRSPEEIERFRTSIHHLTLASRIRNRFEARTIVAKAAQAGRQALGIEPTTTILQFVFGAVGLLDPYSSFMSPAELSETESQIEGNFVGLGIALQPHEAPLRVLNVIEGGPALEAGLQAGDLILEIGSVRCEDVGAERAADLLRGPAKSHVRLLIQREDDSQFDCVVARRRVEVPSVEDAKMLEPENKIAYLKISSFQKTTAQELDQALWKLHRQGMERLIIDLRGNPGGWLDASVAVADRFINEGGIVSTRGKNGIENQNYTATLSGTWQIPLVLLVDDESASASEILAGAIRDNRRGVLVGQTTYGKGSVQGLFHTKTLGNGIRLTVSKFYSPNGRAISEQGVQPHVFVAEDPEPAAHYVSKPAVGTGEKPDRALQVALEHARSRDLTARNQFSRN